MARKPPPLVPGGTLPSTAPPAGPPPSGGLNVTRTLPGGASLTASSAPPGKPGQKAGMPNFKSRITKAGGMKKGGVVKAGQGSGVGRLQRSK